MDGTALKKSGEHFTSHKDAAVTCEFHGVFSRERIRPEKYGEQAVVDQRPGLVADFTAPGEAGHRGGCDPAGAAIRDLQCMRSGDPDEGDRAHSKRTRDGCDGRSRKVGHAIKEVDLLL